jgi:hypothetical protein
MEIWASSNQLIRDLVETNVCRGYSVNHALPVLASVKVCLVSMD